MKSVTHADTRAFLSETISCYEQGLLRASVVLSWVVAVAALRQHVLLYRLDDFNAEMNRRAKKWKPAKTADDLGNASEYEFLQVLEALSIIGRNVKHELEVCLKLRNGCGHPNSLKLGENRVASHIEVLINNVFTRFSV